MPANVKRKKRDTASPCGKRPRRAERRYRRIYFQYRSCPHRLSHRREQRKNHGRHGEVKPKAGICKNVAHSGIDGEPQAVFQNGITYHNKVEKTLDLIRLRLLALPDKPSKKKAAYPADVRHIESQKDQAWQGMSPLVTAAGRRGAWLNGGAWGETGAVTSRFKAGNKWRLLIRRARAYNESMRNQNQEEES